MITTGESDDAKGGKQYIRTSREAMKNKKYRQNCLSGADCHWGPRTSVARDYSSSFYLLLSLVYLIKLSWNSCKTFHLNK